MPPLLPIRLVSSPVTTSDYSWDTAGVAVVKHSCRVEPRRCLRMTCFAPDLVWSLGCPFGGGAASQHEREQVQYHVPKARRKQEALSAGDHRSHTPHHSTTDGYLAVGSWQTWCAACGLARTGPIVAIADGQVENCPKGRRGCMGPRDPGGRGWGGGPGKGTLLSGTFVLAVLWQKYFALLFIEKGANDHFSDPRRRSDSKNAIFIFWSPC